MSYLTDKLVESQMLVVHSHTYYLMYFLPLLYLPESIFEILFTY